MSPIKKYNIRNNKPKSHASDTEIDGWIKPNAVSERKKNALVKLGAVGVSALALLGVAKNSTNNSSSDKVNEPSVEYTVRPGDTDWDIAERYADPNSEIRDDVDHLADQHKGMPLQIGQTLLLTGDLAENYKQIHEAEAIATEHNQQTKTQHNS